MSKSDEQYYELAIALGGSATKLAHQSLRMERTPDREILIMSPTRGESGWEEEKLSCALDLSCPD